MRIQYDPEVDVLVVDLGDLKTSVGAEEIAPGVWLDRDAEGTPLSIEVLGAGKRYPMAELAQHPPDYEAPLALAEAALTLGVTPQALQKAIVRGRLRGRKIGKTWFTSIAAITAYANSRAHEGPGSAVRAARRGGERPATGPGGSRPPAAPPVVPPSAAG